MASPSTIISLQEAQRLMQVQHMLLQFSELFKYDEPNDLAIAIVGVAFLDKLLEEALRNYFVDDDREVQKLLQPEGHLGTFGAHVSMALCVGLIYECV